MKNASRIKKIQNTRACKSKISDEFNQDKNNACSGFHGKIQDTVLEKSKIYEVCIQGTEIMNIQAFVEKSKIPRTCNIQDL